MDVRSTILILNHVWVVFSLICYLTVKILNISFLFKFLFLNKNNFFKTLTVKNNLKFDTINLKFDTINLKFAQESDSLS
jgi:hypothetical protein